MKRTGRAGEAEHSEHSLFGLTKFPLQSSLIELQTERPPEVHAASWGLNIPAEGVQL